MKKRPLRKRSGFLYIVKAKTLKLAQKRNDKQQRSWKNSKLHRNPVREERGKNKHKEELKMQEKNRLPLNLQFFAEGDEPAADPKVEQQDDAESIDSLKQQLAEERAAKAKDKAALDKALKQVGDLTKQLRSKQTQQEIEDEAKRAAEEETKEHIAALEAYKRENEAKERYLLQGMDAEMAKKAAAAEVAGDMDALADIQRQHTDTLIKAKEAEWKKSMPKAHIGDGNYPAMTKEEILAIEDDEERTKAIARHLDMFT